MASKGQHVHMIDGQSVPYDNATCPLCHPELQQQKPTAEPQVYRKGETVVVKISKGVMMTTTYWKDKNVLLHTISRMQRGADGKVLLDTGKQPLWAKTTTRLSIAVAEQFVMELSKLIRDVTQKASVPTRG